MTETIVISRRRWIKTLLKGVLLKTEKKMGRSKGGWQKDHLTYPLNQGPLLIEGDTIYYYASAAGYIDWSLLVGRARDFSGRYLFMSTPYFL